MRMATNAERLSPSFNLFLEAFFSLNIFGLQLLDGEVRVFFLAIKVV